MKHVRRRRKMLKVKINEKEYKFPESFDEISMSDYCRVFYDLMETTSKMSEDEIRIITLKNEAKIISRLLHEDDDFVQSLPLEVFGMLREKAFWIYDISSFLDSKNFYLKIDGKKYFIPNPEEMSLRQYIDADMTMKEKDNKQQFIELLSILLLPLGDDGKYKYDGNYKELIPKIEKMSASEGLPFIYTFFKKKVISKRLTEDFSKVREAAQQVLSIQNS